MNAYEQHGQRQPGQDQVVSQKILRSTAFFRPGKAVETTELFKAAQDKFWNNFKIPVDGNFMYDVNAIRLDSCIQFEVGADATRNAILMKTFIESAFVQIDHVKLKDMYNIPLSELVPYRYIETIDAAGVWSIQRVDKQTDAAWFPLDQVLQFGKGITADISIVVPPGYVTEGYAVGTTPILHGVASGVLPAESPTPANGSYYLKLNLMSTEIAQS